MERITPIDIESAELPTAWRGYNRDMTRAFLNQIAEEMTRLRTRVSALETEREGLAVQVKTYQDQAELMNQTLMLAQSAAEERKIAAEREASAIIHEAELMASQAERDATLARRRRLHFESQFRKLLEEYLDGLPAPTTAVVEQAAVEDTISAA